MTSEDDFQDAIDRDRFNWTLRLVFADWLEEHEDRRAEGYRALGVLQLTPAAFDLSEKSFFWVRENSGWHGYAMAQIPGDVFDGLKVSKVRTRLSRVMNFAATTGYETRRELEDDFAYAFASLPAKRRAALLQGVMV